MSCLVPQLPTNERTPGGNEREHLRSSGPGGGGVPKAYRTGRVGSPGTDGEGFSIPPLVSRQ